MARTFSHSSSQFLTSVDTEIERLQHLREQVASAIEAEEAVLKPVERKRKGMSADGRRKIAEAQKARWAKQKRQAKAAAKKAATKKVDGKKTAAKPVVTKTSRKTAPAKIPARSTAPKAAATAEQV